MSWPIFIWTVAMIGVGFAFGYSIGEQNARPTGKVEPDPTDHAIGCDGQGNVFNSRGYYYGRNACAKCTATEQKDKP